MKYLSKDTNVWFNSDLHFGHKHIMKFCPFTRSGKDVTEMNKLIVDAHNSVVGDSDHVYLLGDISFLKEADTWELLYNMKGVLHLISGNHDHVINKSNKLKCLFVEVRDQRNIYIDNVKIQLNHFPIESWDGGHHGSYHLHGHEHGRFNNHELNTTYRRMDVGIDARQDNLMLPRHWSEIHGILKDRVSFKNKK